MVGKQLEFLILAVLWGVFASVPFALIGILWGRAENRGRIIASIIFGFLGAGLLAGAAYALWLEFIRNQPFFLR
jgi:hypothetical protein